MLAALSPLRNGVGADFPGGDGSDFEEFLATAGIYSNLGSCRTLSLEARSKCWKPTSHAVRRWGQVQDQKQTQPAGVQDSGAGQSRVKLETVKLVRVRGASVGQACRYLDLHENVVRKSIRLQVADPKCAFPGHGQMMPEQRAKSNTSAARTGVSRRSATRARWPSRRRCG